MITKTTGIAYLVMWFVLILRIIIFWIFQLPIITIRAIRWFLNYELLLHFRQPFYKILCHPLIHCLKILLCNYIITIYIRKSIPDVASRLIAAAIVMVNTCVAHAILISVIFFYYSFNRKRCQEQMLFYITPKSYIYGVDHLQ